jgi:hypothetical protein
MNFNYQASKNVEYSSSVHYFCFGDAKRAIPKSFTNVKFMCSNVNSEVRKESRASMFLNNVLAEPVCSIPQPTSWHAHKIPQESSIYSSAGNIDTSKFHFSDRQIECSTKQVRTEIEQAALRRYADQLVNFSFSF